MITNQAYLFLIFTLNGIIIGLLFDFFRILRKSFKTSDFVTYVEDILFWILTGLLILYSIFIFNNGEIRFFMFLGIAIGIALYMLLLSKHIIWFSVFIINILKKVLTFIGKVVLYPIAVAIKFIRKIFIKPITFLFINLTGIYKKNLQIFQKSIHKTTNDVKNITKKIKISKKSAKKEGI